MNNLKKAILILCIPSISILSIFAEGSSEALNYAPDAGLNPLMVPELLDSRITPEITLEMQNGKHEFYSGIESNTMGFNGNYLGPQFGFIEIPM